MTDASGTTAPPGPGPVGGVAAVLTVAAAVVGALPWPSPERTRSGWQVADVPPSLWGLVVGAALLCLVAAGLLVRPRSLPGRLAPVTFWLVCLASVFALGWDALYAAALSDGTSGAVIPVFHWLFTSVPAFVVGLAVRDAGPRTQLRATLGTAVVTLPLFTLGWALLAPPWASDTARDALLTTAVLGVVPLSLAVALTRAGVRRP
ncbi:hypothetical protein ACI784_24480 [Geodermatophilus sp. SYSU D01186]